MVTIIGLRLSGTVKSLHMPEVSDRRIPFMITSLYFLLTTWFLYQKTTIDPVLWLGMAVICISVLVLTAVSFFLENVCPHDRNGWVDGSCVGSGE